MSTARTLTTLMEAAAFDIATPGENVLQGPSGVSYSRRGGKCNRLLKVLLHGGCAYDCGYCGIRTKRRCSLEPKRLAESFLSMHRQGKADGLFLSSGIPGDVDQVMEGIIRTGEILRARGFEGYLHLKVLPGAARTDITDAARLADRISINLEAPSASRLSEIAGVKDFRQDIEKRQAWVADAMPGRHTTQIVVGAAGESDAEILRCMDRQYRHLRTSRVYYSAFTPLAGTPLQEHDPTPSWRQNRLYQADALVRAYGWRADAIADVLDEEGNLPDADPKALLARGMPPLDVNTASYGDLLRVPGIGPRGARRILIARKMRPILTENDLRQCGVVRKEALHHLILGDREMQTSLSAFL
ncbi:radical SAM protein [Methanofollis fontis]|uniref:Radical SAM protein n=1 Tax=Methanofollis fontis TaxID=2052832 RepID=A0A483CU91_9EURY|nr:radical SAM protein [Methanofollis fontis]TAJ45033.1 radical SAM protein [Methanofollis fontis]